jgi:predicted RNA-binding protein with RPS1 domain
VKRDWKVGDGIQWSILRGDRYSGVIVEIDNYTAFVLCDDGVTRTVGID